MRSLVFLGAIAGLALPSCGDAGTTSRDADAVTTTSTVAVPTTVSPTTQPPTTSLAPIQPVSDSELLESITPSATSRRTVTPIADVRGLNGDEAQAALRSSLNIHSCNALYLVDVLSEIDDEGLVANWGDGTEVVLAGSSDALHAAFVMLAAWLEHCEQHPYSANLEADEYEVYHEPLRTLSIGDESFMIAYGLTLRDQPFCDHKLVVVRDDDRLVVIDTYGGTAVPVMTDRELSDKAEEAVARLHT